MENDIPLPYDLNNERAVLGACLIDRDVITVIRNILSMEDFYLEKHAQIYAAMINAAWTHLQADRACA
ncbi:MAG: DnaB-like helicase N-terminal domain-containing protein [Chloroflexales bacterium]